MHKPKMALFPRVISNFKMEKRGVEALPAHRPTISCTLVYLLLCPTLYWVKCFLTLFGTVKIS